ncbi:hypothetical protein [Solibacillus sp. R5-41]|uniref:hypothetical protein n=1 Tax=Solibacillus sp. R5-41 TaxID=2048654 RepID=UPI0020A50DD7|nr:hypothetical protein [Solibacillus sp. R5-41]
MEQTITNSKRTIIVAIVLSAPFVSILNQTLLMIAMPPIMADFKKSKCRTMANHDLFIDERDINSYYCVFDWALFK